MSFSPAHPTRRDALFPRFVFGSTSSSMDSTWAKEPVLAGSGRVGENRYASGLVFACTLAGDQFEPPGHHHFKIYWQEWDIRIRKVNHAL